MNAHVNWEAVEHVLLDMDGTVLDLAFDNHFWREMVPARYAARHGLTLDQALAQLLPRFSAIQGTLDWYCLDYWSEVTQVNLAAMKEELKHLIAPLAGAEDFLSAVKHSGRELWLATNAHRDSWTVKLRHTELGGWFDQVICAHDFGAPKEDARFWQRLRAAHPFDPARTLFVDDSLPVLRAAREFGIGQVLAIRLPDTTQPARVIEEFASVEKLAELLPLA